MRILLALTAAASIPLSAAHFAPRPGWHVGAGRVHACVGGSVARCREVTSWASTIPWRGCTECIPHDMIVALPPDGLAIQVTLVIEHPPYKVPRASRPSRVKKSDVASGMEGVPNHGVVERFVRVGGYEADVWIFFGRSKPTATQLRAANAELAAARLPR
jgi:hypothetical protein